MKTLLVRVGLGALLSLSALTAPAQTKQLQWKQRTEIQRNGETKSVQVVLVTTGTNGQTQTTPISRTPEPDLPKFRLRKVIAEKKFKQFKETVQELGELARSYSNLPPDQMQRFMTTATVTPEMRAQQKLVRAEGQNVLHTGDSMIVWVDAISRKQRRVEIQTTFDGKPVRIVSEFQDLPHGGPTYPAISRLNYDGGAIVIITENFDHLATD